MSLVCVWISLDARKWLVSLEGAQVLHNVEAEVVESGAFCALFCRFFSWPVRLLNRSLSSVLCWFHIFSTLHSLEYKALLWKKPEDYRGTTSNASTNVSICE